MQGAQLRYVIKFVNDMDKAVKFHGDVLGLKVKFESPGWSEFATGETTLALHPASDKNPAGKVELGFTVADVEAFYRDMTAKGVLFSGSEWIVDADLRDFFGSVDHEKLLTFVAQRVADGRVLRLIKSMLKAGSYGKGQLSPSERGTPQGGVVSPVLSNVLLTPFDREMRLRSYQLTRYADDGAPRRRGEESVM